MLSASEGSLYDLCNTQNISLDFSGYDLAIQPGGEIAHRKEAGKSAGFKRFCCSEDLTIRICQWIKVGGIQILSPPRENCGPGKRQAQYRDITICLRALAQHSFIELVPKMRPDVLAQVNPRARVGPYPYLGPRSERRNAN